GLFYVTIPGSAYFSIVDIVGMTTESLTITTMLMFIGGGSASTACGIKVATFFLLAFVIWAEIRGEPDVTVGRRRIASPAHREAMSVALLGLGLVATGTLLMVMLTKGFPFEYVMFDVVSAFGTVGLSTGVTMNSPAPAQLVLAALMFIGRIGPAVVATALALNTRRR